MSTDNFEVEARVSGRWWLVWLSDQKDVRREVEALGKKLGFTNQDILTAVNELRTVYGEHWFLQNYYPNPLHPVVQYLLSPTALINFLSAMELGLALSERLSLWGNASRRKEGELRNPQGFHSFAYELEALAWLKKGADNLVIEEELNLPAGALKSPDCKVTFKGETSYVELSYMNAWEQTRGTMEPLLRASKAEAAEKLGREIPAKLALEEIRRLAEKVVLEGVEKAPGDAPLILMARPPSVLILYVLSWDTAAREAFSTTLFQMCSQMCRKYEGKLWTVSRLVIDIPAGSAHDLTAFDSYRDFPREPICFGNPLFVGWS